MCHSEQRLTPSPAYTLTSQPYIQQPFAADQLARTRNVLDSRLQGVS
jgi:hypothetical protein